MKVLSLDMALANTAFVLFNDSEIEAFDIFCTEKLKERWLTAAEGDQKRVNLLVTQLNSWIDLYKPDVIVVEQPLSAAQSSSALKALSLVSGIIYTFPLIHPSKIPWVYMRVHDIKQALLNKRRSTTKVEVIEAVTKLYPSIKEHLVSTRAKSGYLGIAEHIADAIAVYIAFKESPTFKIMESMK